MIIHTYLLIPIPTRFSAHTQQRSKVMVRQACYFEKIRKLVRDKFITFSIAKGLLPYGMEVEIEKMLSNKSVNLYRKCILLCTY